jgi:hypothetical protein
VVRRHATATIAAVLVLFAVWNLALMSAAQDGAVRIGETLAFDRAWASQAHVVHAWFGNPFTYPASLAFALQNGVSPGDYDLLSTNRFLADPLRPYGSVDVGIEDDWLLAEGWHAPEREGAVTFRWAASPATLRIPLDHAARLRVQLRVHAFSYPGAPPQTLTVWTNSAPALDTGTAAHSCGPLAVSADWQTIECSLDATAWRSGVNTLTLQFGYAQRPVDVGVGADPRPLAAAVDWVRVSVVP